MNELAPGATLYGFCSGIFGRDSYADKVVIAAGTGWLVAKDVSTNSFVLAQGDDVDLLKQHVTPQCYDCGEKTMIGDSNYCPRCSP